MFGLSITEVLIIMVVALVSVGPKRMPTVLKAVGRALAEFRNAMTEVRTSVMMDVRQPLEELKKPLKESSTEYLDRVLAEREKIRVETEAHVKAMMGGEGGAKAMDSSPYPEEQSLAGENQPVAEPPPEKGEANPKDNDAAPGGSQPKT